MNAPNAPEAIERALQASRAVTAVPGRGARPRAAGKFIFADDSKLLVRGVTYGTFASEANGDDYPPDEVLLEDFAAMAASGINAVRCYTVPPRRLLDAALRHGLWIMVGLPWEQHVTFLDDRRRADDIVRRVREGVRACAGHPAVLCYAVGNEIPGPIVRWHGARRIERFIKRLYDAVKAQDPDALVTYVNFPTTEYLRLPFLDLFCFNVYLESRDRLEAYLARLQNLAGEKPLLMAEIGLDSRRNGLDKQAESLDWQIRTAFAEGCAGVFAFAWTDEWHRGGFQIDDWDFGLVTRERAAKPALAAVRQAYAEVPFPAHWDWPRISVVICSCNGARTIRDTLEALTRVDYPDFEVIVIDDGSTDETARIAAGYDVQLISTENRGLSAARNTGWQKASGEIVAYIDDDAYPDPHWLHFLAYRFMTGDWVGVGGPNIAPPGDGLIAECVANAPGGPVHVLISDLEAEHIPGCNMAFRRSALEAIGGFDPRYRAAGDDVDICWRLRDCGWRIGFHAAAMDWHHRRNSLRMYWRQQKGYGKAEALLEEKWPDRYNTVGHVSWSGRLYGRGLTPPVAMARSRIYGGIWGSGAYQSLYEPVASTYLMFPLMPEWLLFGGLLTALVLLGLSWSPMLWLWPATAIVLALPVAQAGLAASRAAFRDPNGLVFRRLLTFLMHLMQPVARLIGRIAGGLTLWRRRKMRTIPANDLRTTIWSENWRSPEEWVARLELALRRNRISVRTGGPDEPWDLSVRCGAFVEGLVSVCVEEHGAGRQLVRLRCRRRLDQAVFGLILACSTLSALALADQAWIAGALLAVPGLWFLKDVFLPSASAWEASTDLAKALEAGQSAK